MASSTTGKQFRRTLLRVSEVLTKKNIHDLAFLCETISPARREELKDALDLFGLLQGHDLLNENNVNTLIEWLEELRLMEASKLLRDYRSQYLEPAVTSQAMCHIHEDVALKYVCVSCVLAGKMEIDTTRRRGYNDGASGMTSVGTLVGAVSIRPDQLLKILDDRDSTGMVWMVSVDPVVSGKEYWRHSMDIDNHRSPVVTSPGEMFYGLQKHIPIAVGKIVYIVHPYWNGHTYDSVESIEPMVIDEVPEGSWITNITVRRTPTGEDHASSRSSVIKLYNISGKLVRSIETKGHVLSSDISGMACYNTTLAVLGRGSDDVILLSVEEGTVKQGGCLEPPPAGFTPTFVSWTGHCWLLLLMTSGRKKKWKVVKYYDKGMMVKECQEGDCRDESDVPVSLTQCKATGYVTSSSKICVFKY